MSEGEKKAAARAAYTEGVQLQDQGKPSEALAKFETAQKLFDAPTHLLHIAECQALTGKLVEAAETYELLIRKQLPTGSPEVFVQAQEQAKAELPPLRQRLPSLRLTVKPEQSTLKNLEIQINDKQYPVELIGISRPVNPGSYTLTAKADGYATPQPMKVEIKEKESKPVELTLVAGATAPPVGATGTDGTSTTNPPTDPNKDKDKDKKVEPESPSSTGLLLGARFGAWVPGGSVLKDQKFDKVASAGPGVGLDLIGRFARFIIVGGSLELASLGAPDASAFPQGAKADVTTTTVYLGALAGILPNVDKVSFIADLDLGLRILNNSQTITGLGQTTKAENTYSGFEIGLQAGVSIPAGPIRIVPKAGIAYGTFTAQECSNTAGGTTTSGCGIASATGVQPTVDTDGHTFLSVALGIYYHLDLAKRKAAATQAPGPQRFASPAPQNPRWW